MHFSQLFIFLFITNLKKIVLYIIFRLEKNHIYFFRFLKICRSEKKWIAHWIKVICTWTSSRNACKLAATCRARRVWTLRTRDALSLLKCACSFRNILYTGVLFFLIFLWCYKIMLYAFEIYLNYLVYNFVFNLQVYYLLSEEMNNKRSRRYVFKFLSLWLLGDESSSGNRVDNNIKKLKFGSIVNARLFFWIYLIKRVEFVVQLEPLEDAWRCTGSMQWKMHHRTSATWEKAA